MLTNNCQLNLQKENTFVKLNIFLSKTDQVDWDSSKLKLKTRFFCCGKN